MYSTGIFKKHIIWGTLSRNAFPNDDEDDDVEDHTNLQTFPAGATTDISTVTFWVAIAT